MVKRYEPVSKWFSEQEDYSPTMKESRYGEYVSLVTYKNEAARMNAQIARLQKKVNQLNTQLKD